MFDLTKSLFIFLFLRLAGSHLLDQLILIARALAFDASKVLLEIVEKLGQLVLFNNSIL